MTTSVEKAGMPPMISHDDVVSQAQQTDLKEFRKYLIQSGAVKSLVKLYQHTLKNEIRMDNPNVVADYMKQYRDDDDPQVGETETLIQENSDLRQTNVDLAQKIAQLEAAMEQETRRRSCKVLWKLLTSPQFWTSRSGMDEESAAALKTEGLTGAQLFERLCGTLYDPNIQADLDLMELVRPKGLTTKIDPESFTKFLVEESHPDTFDWSQNELVPMLESEDPPFEKALVADIQGKIEESGLQASDLELVSNMVSLDPGLRDFLESLITYGLPQDD
jgi:hypothetical protein